MRNELNQFKTLFEQVRGLGILQNLPNDTYSEFSEHIKIWFADNYDVTSVDFGTRYNEKVEIMKYSSRDNSYKVSLPIDITDVELSNLLIDVNEDYRKAKIAYLKSELAELELEEEVV